MNKMTKKFSYKKVTPDMKIEMKRLREKGNSYDKISKIFDVNSSTVDYHLNDKYRKQSIKRAMKFYFKLTKEQIKEKNKKAYPKRKEYLTKRYHEDEEFRKRFIGYVQNSFEKRRKIWIKQNKCLVCGGDKIEKRWECCEKCREKRRTTKQKR